MTGSTHPGSGSPVPVFPGDSVMARAMRAFDWTASPLGPPQNWPASLAGACRICLTSRFPMIIWWGPGLRFLYNDAYLPLLGGKHPALGRRGREVWSDIWHVIGPMLDGVTATGEATWSDDLLLATDRHGYLEQTYWTYSYSPLHNDDGTVGGVFTAVTETTGRVVAGRRLTVLRDLGAQAGTARSLAEACDLIMAVLARSQSDVPYAELYLRAPDSDTLSLAATTAGAPASPLPGGPGGWPVRQAAGGFEPMVVDDLARRFAPLPTGAWETPPTQAALVPLRGEAGGGAVGVLVVAASAGRALDDEYLAFLGLLGQHTAAVVNSAIAYQAQERRGDELAELDRAKTQFFSNISHEFRTPLTLIMGPVQELRHTLAQRGDHTLRTELDAVYRNSLRLGRLVNSLLDFSRLQAGRMQASFAPVDLAELTGYLAGMFRSAIERAGLCLTVDCQPQPQPVYTDPEMWEKVLANLLSNALKFTFAGTVAVSLTPGDGHAVLRVSDTGTGIPPDELPHLFERFHRVQHARARSAEGSGIGLALVRDLVVLHGGTVTVDSTPEVGSTFTVRIPWGTRHLPPGSIRTDAPAPESLTGLEPFLQEALRWQVEPAGAEAPVPDGSAPVAPGAAPAGRRDRVLVADDNRDMREYLCRLLAPYVDVTPAADGAQALALVRAELPDLVLSDVMMPQVDGLELLARLRADPRTARVPVLLLSARAGEEAAVDGLAAGADDYLVKPFSARELVARVQANLRLAGLRQQHTRWRSTMLDAVQQAFFVADAHGTVVEINEAFAALLGYPTDAVPYPAPQPWWPDPAAEPDRYATVRRLFAEVLHQDQGTATAALRHRDGTTRWVTGTFQQATDPATGQRMIVGSLRDVTAERLAAEREAAVARMTARLSGATGLGEVAAAAVAELRRAAAARQVLLAVFDPADQVTLTAAPAGPTWTSVPGPVREAIGKLRQGSPLELVPLPASVHPNQAGAGISVRFHDQTMVVWLERDANLPWRPADGSLLALLCGHFGQAMNRAQRFDQQRAVALTLQRSILGPATLPAGFAVRYEPAVPPLEVGGDWYDVIELPDGRIAVVVGDSVGRGLPAAAVMGQLRSACRALLLEASSPARTLGALDRFAAMIPGALCTTVFCAILDPVGHTLRYSSAGHPPGILAGSGGGYGLLDRATGLPLAAVARQRRPEATVAVPPDAVLVLYTDGLVERRGRLLDTGIAQAGEVVVAARAVPVDDLADRLMRALAPAEGFTDDVAVLVYRQPGRTVSAPPPAGLSRPGA